MILLKDSVGYIFELNGISIILNHELKGCFQNISGLKFNEGIESLYVCVIEQVLSLLGFDYLVNKIGIKVSHY